MKEVELKCGPDKAVRQMIHRAIKKQYPMLSSTTRNGVIVVSRGGGRKGSIQTLFLEDKEKQILELIEIIPVKVNF